MNGNDGHDNIHGSYGNDNIYGQNGAEFYTLCGNYACGELVGGNGDDYIEGGIDADYIYSNSDSADSDSFHGQDGNGDRVSVVDTDTADFAAGGAGSDDLCWYDYYQNTSSPDQVDNSCDLVQPEY